jgi:serine/threonine protein kinase
MPDQSACPECGAALPANAPQGLCPYCLACMGMTLFAGASEPIAQPAGVESAARRFGDYELLDEIARGGMGIVYRARQVSLNRIVAVKVLLFGQFSSEELVERFRSEAEAAAALQHPNIVAIHEIGEHDGQRYFSMAYIEGKNLAELARDKPLPAKLAATYLQIVAEAIHYAHQRGVLHRDLKPSNVLVDSDGQPHVTDFGLAKRLGDESELTVTGQMLGSPSYMSPEQADRKRGEVTSLSDVYSLGAVLYHLLSGRAPFVGETLEDTLLQLLNAEPVAPRVLNASVPRDLETICLKCLNKEPVRRYTSANALAADLGRWQSGEPIDARPVSRVEMLWRWCRRKPAVAALGVAVTFLLLVLGERFKSADQSRLGNGVWGPREARPIRDIPQRSWMTPARLIDLGPYYNDGLTDNWNARHRPGNNLAVLPQGRRTFANVEFDVRGVIQLSGKEITKHMPSFPETVAGMKVRQRCRQLHFLHTTGWKAPEGSQIGTFLIHYANGQCVEYPIRYGEHVRDGWLRGDPRDDLKGGTCAWIGTNAAGDVVRVFKSTWTNPSPSQQIASLDFVSTMTSASPILIAVTTEP